MKKFILDRRFRFEAYAKYLRENATKMLFKKLLSFCRMLMDTCLTKFDIYQGT